MSKIFSSIAVLAVPLVLTLSTSQLAQAANKDGLFAVRGIGAQTCRALNDALSAENSTTVRSALSIWTAGWISHANRVSDGIFDAHPVLNNSDVAVLVERLCQSNPDAVIETVLASSTAAIASGVTMNESPSVTIENEGRSVVLREAVLQKAQDILVEEGLLEAKQADGKYGPNTAKALSRFQKDSGAEVTGLPDAVTLYLLFVDG